MANRVKTTQRFNLKLSKVFDYVLDNWGTKVADKFSEVAENRLLLLEKYPGMGRPSSKKPKIRRMLVGKQNIVYYSRKRSSVSVHNLFSAYGDPGKNPYG